jgi:hypothetical protein
MPPLPHPHRAGFARHRQREGRLWEEVRGPTGGAPVRGSREEEGIQLHEGTIWSEQKLLTVHSFSTAYTPGWSVVNHHFISDDTLPLLSLCPLQLRRRQSH